MVSRSQNCKTAIELEKLVGCTQLSEKMKRLDDILKIKRSTTTSPFFPSDPTKDFSAMGNTQKQTDTEKIYAVFSGVCSTLKLVFHISILLMTERFEKNKKNLEPFLQNQNGTIIFN